MKTPVPVSTQVWLARSRKDVLAQAAAIRTLAEKVAHGPDRESIHRLRVSTRRLTAGLPLIAPDKKDTEELKAELSALRRALGMQRQLDVAIENAKAYGLDTAPIVYVRDRASRKVQKRLDGLFRQELAEHLDKVTKQDAPTDARVLLKAIKKEVRFCKNVKGHWPKKKSKRHQIRIRLKKARYLLENLGFLSPQLKEVQDAIGRARDLRTLRHWAEGNPEIRRDEKAAWKLAKKKLDGALDEVCQVAKQATKRLDS